MIDHATPLRVAIVDDHPMFRMGLAAAISEMDGIELVGEAENGDQVAALIETVSPTVLLLDLHLPGASGLEVNRWLAEQETRGRAFTAEQRIWLEAIRDHVSANLEIEMDDFEYAPFNTLGGAGKAYKLFGVELEKVMDELNEVLAA